jgi:hypothetical protein
MRNRRQRNAGRNHTAVLMVESAASETTRGGDHGRGRDLSTEFANPGVESRPRFRCWWPGALVDRDVDDADTPGETIDGSVPGP